MKNSVQIDGRLTRDPEIKLTQAGKTIITFSIAHDKRKKDASGNWVEDGADFFDIDYWPNDPQYWGQRLTKGTAVCIEGTIKQDRWQDQASGETRSRVKITANAITYPFVPTIAEQNAARAAHAGTPAPTQAPTPATAPAPDWAAPRQDDIPF